MSKQRSEGTSGQALLTGACTRSLATRAAADANVLELDTDKAPDVNFFDRGPQIVVSTVGDLVILSGLGGDVPPGTLLKFGANGATGILLAHREPKSFAIRYTNTPTDAPAVGAAAAAPVLEGDAVEVLHKQTFRVPAEEEVRGRFIGALGQPLDGGRHLHTKRPQSNLSIIVVSSTQRPPGKQLTDLQPSDKQSRDTRRMLSCMTCLGGALDGGAVPGGGGRDVTSGGSELCREPPRVEDRKPITTPMLTGIKAMDLLTPIGRGQCMLVTVGPDT
jgi:hypothetical protein